MDGVGSVKIGLGGQFGLQPFVDVKRGKEVDGGTQGQHDPQGGQQVGPGQPPGQGPGTESTSATGAQVAQDPFSLLCVLRASVAHHTSFQNASAPSSGQVASETRA